MSSDHKEFTPDVGTANDTSVQNASDYKEYQDFLVFSHCAEQNPEEFLGPTPQTKSTSLLIKLNMQPAIHFSCISGLMTDQIDGNQKLNRGTLLKMGL